MRFVMAPLETFTCSMWVSVARGWKSLCCSPLCRLYVLPFSPDVRVRDFDAVENMFAEVMSFCLDHAQVSEAVNLYKNLTERKKMMCSAARDGDGRARS